MAITQPVDGAGSEAQYTNVYACLMSLNVAGVQRSDAYTACEIEGTSTSEALTGLEVTSSTDRRLATMGLGVGNKSSDTYLQASRIIDGPSFLIMADVVAEALVNPGENGSYEIRSRLLVNSVEVKHRDFTFERPTGKLGGILNITLATNDRSVVPPKASIRFELVVTANGQTGTYVLLDQGKLQERSCEISVQQNQGPTDNITISALDVVSDKFGLAPRRPVIMFDPNRVRYDTINTDSSNLVRDEQGRKVMPVIEPVRGLSMRQILNRAYTGLGGYGGTSYLTPGYQAANAGWMPYVSTPGNDQAGMGYTGVVTNIPNYPVKRADFSIESGWHAGAEPVVSMFSPVYFVEGTRLFIYDIDRPLPAGITAYPILLSRHKKLVEKVQYRPDMNAVLLTYQYEGTDPYEDAGKLQRMVFTDQVVSETGSPGDEGYSKVTVRRWDREYYFASNPTEVLDTLPLSEQTEVVGTIMFKDKDGNVTWSGTDLISRENIDYVYSGPLKIGHRRNKSGIIFVPFGSHWTPEFQPIEEETCDIVWQDDPDRLGVKVQMRNVTRLWSRVYVRREEIEVDPGVSTVMHTNLYTPDEIEGSLTDPEDWSLTGGMTVVRETINELVRGRGRQMDVRVTSINKLTGRVENSYTDPTSGGVEIDQYETNSITILLRDLVSEAAIGPRIPESVNAMELPRTLALEIGRRILRRFSDPLQTMPVDLPGVDFSIAQGSVITGQRRSGVTTNHIVTGYRITGQNLGKEGHRIFMSMDTLELLGQ